MDFPSLSRLLNIGQKHNPTVWDKHRRFICIDEEHGAARRALEYASRFAGQTFTRAHVLDLCRQDFEAGLIASIIWGFPKGGRPGGAWQDFAKLFANSNKLATQIKSLKATTPQQASDVLGEIQACFHGIGFATITKVLYFGGLNFIEGPSLIYDKNVIDVIIHKRPEWMSKTAEELKSGKQLYGPRSPAIRSYSCFIAEANAKAAALGIQADQVEAGLFLAGAKPGSW